MGGWVLDDLCMYGRVQAWGAPGLAQTTEQTPERNDVTEAQIPKEQSIGGTLFDHASIPSNRERTARRWRCAACCQCSATQSTVLYCTSHAARVIR